MPRFFYVMRTEMRSKYFEAAQNNWIGKERRIERKTNKYIREVSGEELLFEKVMVFMTNLYLIANFEYALWL